MRASQSPFEALTPVQALARNSFGDNVGNLVFSHAACRLLSTSRTHLTTTRGLPPDPGWLNENYDLVVLPLANAFRQAFVPELERMTSVIQRLRIPVVVLGVNAQLDLGAKEPRGAINEPVKEFVKAVLRNSPHIGVRGEITTAYLRRLGFTDEDMVVIGCPSMFMTGPELPEPRAVERIEQDSPISMNLSPYVKGVGKVLREQAGRYPNLVYTAQDIAMLRLLLTGQYSSKLPSRADVPTSIDDPLVARGRTVVPVSVASWLQHLRGVDFSFGTRIHGNIASILAGTPAFVLAHDSRTAELARYHDIPHRVFRASDDRPDAAELYEAADFSAMRRGHPERWKRLDDFLSNHHIEHLYSPGAEPGDFDARVAATTYPPVAVANPRLRPRVAAAVLAHRVRTLPRSSSNWVKRATLRLLSRTGDAGR